MPLTITKLGGQLGARIDGVDFSGPLSNNVIQQIAGALYEHQVVSMPAGDMSPEQHAQLAHHFGQPEHNATDQFGIDEQYPFITVIDSDKGDRADAWHADETFLQHPPVVNLLHGKVIPEFGGATAFRSTAAAYEALSDKMKQLLEGLTAIHDYGHLYEQGWRAGFPLAELVGDALQKGLLHSHPVVKTHPFTGRRWLTINSVYTRFIEGLNPLEAEAVLQLLLRHMEKPEFEFRHYWQEGDLLIWDQQAVQHYAMTDYEGRRVVHRIAVLTSAETYTGVKLA